MTRLVIHQDPSGVLGRTISDVRPGQTVIDILAGVDSFDRHNTTVLLNGRKLTFPSFLGDQVIDRGSEEELTRKLTRFDAVNVILETKMMDPFTVALIVSAVSAALTVYTIINMPKVPDARASRSSNNEFYGQTNSARPYEGIPDIYGEMTVYPDLIQAFPVSYYLADKKEIEQVFCVGIGHYEISNEKLGTTLLSQLRGTTVEMFEPDLVTGITTVPDYEEHFECPNISNQDLDYSSGTSSDTISLAGGFDYLLSYDDVTDVATVRIKYNVSSKPTSYPLAGDGVTFNALTTVTGSIDLNGSHNVLDSTMFQVPFTSTVILIMNLRDATVANANFASLASGDYAINAISTATTTSSSNIIGPFDIGAACQSVAIDIVYLAGLNGTVTYEATFEQVDYQGGPVTPGGVNTTFTFDHTLGIASEDVDRRAFTNLLDLSATSGDKLFYRVTLRRTTPHSTEPSEQNRGKVERIAGVNKYDSVEFNNVTIVRITSKQQKGSVSPRNNLYNMNAVRKTITYDIDTGEIVDTLAPSRRFADALLHETVKVFGRDASDIDLDNLYMIQNAIDAKAPELGEFCYSFDDKSVGYRERYEIICNAARVTVFNESGTYMFARDDADKFVSGVITKRDIASERSYSRNFRATMPAKHDSVRLEYVDPITNKKAYVFKTFDNSGNVVDGRGVNQKQIALLGCRNFMQAENRALLECTRILKTHYAVTDTLTSVGSQLNIGDLVLYADTFRTDVASGEIVGRNEGFLKLSEPLVLDVGDIAEITFNDELGSVFGPYEIVSQPDAYTVEIDAFSANDTFTSYISERQLGSRYIISTIGERPAERMIITEKRANEGSGVQVSMTTMVDSLYSFEDWYYQNLVFRKSDKYSSASFIEMTMTFDGIAFAGDATGNVYREEGGLWVKLVTGRTEEVKSLVANDDVIIVGCAGGYGAVSTNNGASFTAIPRFFNSGMTTGDVNPPFDYGHIGVLCQPRGLPNVAFAFVGDKWASKTTDSGATWTALPVNLGLSSNVSDFQCAAISNNGAVIFVGCMGSNAISINGGAAWTELSAAIGGVDNDCFSVGMSGDGTTIVLGLTAGNVAISKNTGSTFTLLPAFLGTAATKRVEAIAVSGDGLRIIVGFGDGYAAYSEDAGDTWKNLPQFLNSGAAYTGDFTMNKIVADLDAGNLRALFQDGSMSTGKWL